MAATRRRKADAPAPVPAVHVLDLPRATARLNQFADRHWAVRSRMKKADRILVALEAHRQGIPRATGKRRVSIEVILAPRKRRPDVDAHQKSLLDSLVHAGLLIDDGPKWAELGSVTYSRGPENRMRVYLEELP